MSLRLLLIKMLSLDRVLCIRWPEEGVYWWWW